MNKKILLSVAAAATLAMTFTGCGSSDSTSTTTSGVAQKSDLHGSDVTIGSGTTKTVNGVWSVLGATGTSIEISGGNVLEVNGTIGAPNTDTFKATISDDNPDNTVSQLTTFLVDNADQGTPAEILLAAQNYFGVTDVYAQPNAMTNQQKARQVAMWTLRKALVGNENALNAAMNTAKIQGASAISDADFLSTMNTIISAVADADSSFDVTDINATMQVIASEAVMALQEEAIISAVYAASIAGTTVTAQAITDAQAQYTDSLILDTNGTADSAGTYGYTLDGSFTALPYTTVGTITTTTANFDDANNTEITFALEDNATTSPAGETGTMTLVLQNLDTDGENANSSYKMVLNNLTVAANTNGYVSFAMNQNVSAAVSAESDSSVAMSDTITYTSADMNTSAICGTNLLAMDDDNKTMEVNVATFANYVRTIAEGESSATNGNYSVDMTGNGNYSLKVYATANDKKFTFNNAYNKAAKYDEGYKIIDANLNK